MKALPYNAYLSNGALASLEVQTKGSEPWPTGTIEMDTFTVEFIQGKRDFESLKRKMR